MPQDNVPNDWIDWMQANTPRRLSDLGLAAQFVGLGIVAEADAAMQSSAEALLARCQDEPTSPDDMLPYIGQEAWLPQYSSETNTAFRLRLDNKWGVWKEAATEGGIVDQLKQAGFPSGSFVPVILFNLPGGGDNGVTDPSSPFYSPEYANTQIPQYPGQASWWSQFALVMLLDSALTSSGQTGAHGLTTGSSMVGAAQLTSSLITDDQLQAMQLIVNKFKPCNWVCREIVLEYLPISGTVVWDQLHQDGSYVYFYDTSAITWAALDVLPSGSIVEHWAVENRWRWKPLFPQQGT